MYTNFNYTSKAAIKRDLAAGKVIECHSPGPWPAPRSGVISLEGPHYPKPHSWYGEGMMRDGKLVSIK
jgi:hypothetical protein